MERESKAGGDHGLEIEDVDLPQSHYARRLLQRNIYPDALPAISAASWDAADAWRSCSETRVPL